MFVNDTKVAWKGLRKLTGMKKPMATPKVPNPMDFCNSLNEFYCRFDKYDFKNIRSDICEFHKNRCSNDIVINEDDVLKCLRSVKIGKSPGPDNITGNIIKLCCEPLTPIMCKIFQHSLNNSTIPTI